MEDRLVTLVGKYFLIILGNIYVYLQRMLKIFPVVLWVDSGMRFSSSEALNSVWEWTYKHTVTTFRLLNGCSVSSYTFKKMLPYFGITDDKVNFAHMIEVCCEDRRQGWVNLCFVFNME